MITVTINDRDISIDLKHLSAIVHLLGSNVVIKANRLEDFVWQIMDICFPVTDVYLGDVLQSSLYHTLDAILTNKSLNTLMACPKNS